MAPRLRILTVLKVFNPETPWQLCRAFVFWELLFCFVYFCLLLAFGQFGAFPVWQHLAIGLLLCAPFLSITMLVVTEHLNLSRKFREMSEMDTLTGLNNRRSFLSQVRKRRNPEDRDVIILLDIDHFKNVNDTYGHQMGDMCLVEVAKFLSGWIRPEDVLCRYGGEEFAVFLKNTSVTYARPIADTVAKGHRFSIGGERLNITFSMGIAQWREGQTLDDVLHNADVALYYCKRNGRAQAQIHREDMAETQLRAQGAA